MPGRIGPMRYSPETSATPTKLLPEATCTAVTVAPGSTASVASVMVPDSVTSWARPSRGVRAISTAHTHIRTNTDFIDRPPGELLSKRTLSIGVPFGARQELFGRSESSPPRRPRPDARRRSPRLNSRILQLVTRAHAHYEAL